MVNYIKIPNDQLDKLLDDAEIAYDADTTRAEKIQKHKDFVAKQEGGDTPDPDAGKEEEGEKDPGEKPTPKMEIIPKGKKSGKCKEFYIVKSRIKTAEKTYEIGDKFPGYPGCEEDLGHALEI